MLRTIDVTDVELGMFIHKLEGSWFKHPFWRSRFLLTDEDTLSDLQCSEINRVIIDTEKGRDVRSRIQPNLPAQPAGSLKAGRILSRRFAPPQCKTARPEPFDLRSTSPLTTVAEFGNAKLVATRARKAISKVFLEARLGKSFKASTVEPVVEEVFASIQRNPHAFNGLMRCKRENEFAYRHALSVCALMVSLANHMKLPPDQVRDAGTVGLLMDVGIAHLPVDLTELGGDFRPLDRALLLDHVSLGQNFLEAAGNFPIEVLRACQQHHERLDGSGYPAALQGSAIGLLARMAAVCDHYDQIVTDGVDYRGLDPASALRRLDEMPEQFDRAIVGHLTGAIGIYPVGSFVRLRSDRLAMVVSDDARCQGRPTVRTFYCLTQDKRIRGETIALSECPDDEIIGTADVAREDIDQLQQLRERLFTVACKS